MRMRTLITLTAALALPLCGLFAEPGTPQDAKARAEAEKQKFEAQKQLAEAEKQLKEAAKKVAELSSQMAKERQSAFVYSVSGKPRLGVIIDTEQETAVDRQGLLLKAVTPGGPADEAGLRTGDILTKVNGKTLARLKDSQDPPATQLRDAVEGVKEGDKVAVEYLRGKEKRSATIAMRVMGPVDFRMYKDMDFSDFEIPDIPDVPDIPPQAMVFLDRIPEAWLDTEMVALNPQLGRYFGATEGVLVIDVPKDSAVPLQPGDVVLRIGDHQTLKPSQAYRVLRSYKPGETATFNILRDKKPLSLKMEVPKESGRHSFRWHQDTSFPAPEPPASKH